MEIGSDATARKFMCVGS